MLKRVVIPISLVLLMVSCYTFKKPEKPKHLLSKKEMVNIIMDLRLLASANGALQRKFEEYGIYSEAYVYKKYKIDSVTFTQNNNYYAFYIDDYNEIYNKVKDSLEELKKDLDALVIKETAEKRKKDSINRVRKKDSLIKVRDSLKLIKEEIKTETHNKPKLIEPVSETTNQSR